MPVMGLCYPCSWPSSFEDTGFRVAWMWDTEALNARGLPSRFRHSSGDAPAQTLIQYGESLKRTWKASGL